MKKAILIYLLCLITSPLFADFEKESLEEFINESEISCLQESEDHVVFINTTKGSYIFELGSCVIEVSFSEVYFYSEDFPRKKYKWICSPAGAGKKSKCYKKYI